MRFVLIYVKVNGCEYFNRFINLKNRVVFNFILELNELSDVIDDEFEMYKGLLIDLSGGDEILKK